MHDNSVSFSSIEHSGLGRFGDPLSANGDVDAVKQIHCSLKPGGLFFLGLPYSGKEKGMLQFNAHRIYGNKRIELLAKGWFIINKVRIDGHTIFVLKKMDTGC